MQLTQYPEKFHTHGKIVPKKSSPNSEKYFMICQKKREIQRL